MTRPPVASGRRTSTRAAPRDAPRWWRRARPGERLACPRGHPFDLSVRIGQGGHACLRCDFCPPPGPPLTQCCGCWIYVVAVTGLGTIIIAVDFPELQAIEACHTPDEVFTLLQVWPEP